MFDKSIRKQNKEEAQGIHFGKRLDRNLIWTSEKFPFNRTSEKAITDGLGQGLAYIMYISIALKYGN